MKKFLLFASLSLLSFTNNFSQTNLVPNSGFETASPCPNYPGQTNYATGWDNVNLVYNNPSVGTPDYFHACGASSMGYNCVPPNTFSGICSPKTGNGFMSCVLYNIPYPGYREYFSTMLSAPMTSGTTYTVSMWLTNGSTPYSPFTIKNVGIHLSAAPLTQSGWALINLTPTCEITNYSGSTGWVQYTFTVNPSSAVQYITVGSFRSDGSNAAVSTYTGTSGANSAYARYYFDDVEVWAPASPAAPTANFIMPTNMCNGTSITYTDATTNSPTSWSWVMPGANPLTSTLKNPSVTYVSAGIFTATLTASNGNGNSTVVKTVTVGYTPVISPAGTSNVCPGNSATLTVSGASSYTWNPGALTGSSVVVTPSVTTTYTVMGKSENCIGVAQKTVNINCVGIHELNSQYADLSVYPNPASDLVNFSSTNAIDEIGITNYLGQKVRTQKFEATEKNISIKDLPAGIYFVQFYNKNELVSTKKLVKE